MNSSNYIIEPSRQTPLLDVDIVVLGAGTAGCIAAMAAAKAGASVMLIEKMPVPGGTLTNGGIGWSSYHSSTDDPNSARQIVGGLPYELACRMLNAGGATGFIPQKDDVHHSPYRFVGDHEVYKGVISEMLLEHNVEVWLQTMLCGVTLREKAIDTVFVENKDGRTAIRAKQYIDCSGDGDLARFVGTEQREIWKEYDKVCGAPTGLVFGMGGIDFDRVLSENPLGAKLLDEQTTESGTLQRRILFVHAADPKRYKRLNDLDIRFFTSIQSNHPGEATYINNSKGVMCDASDARNLSNAELKMRIQIIKMANAFRSEVPGFENAYISWASTQIGIRASRVTVCDKSISQEEICRAARFEDEIGLYGFHDLCGARPELSIGAPGFYGFPYRMLLAKDCDNLYMAGRCVTVEAEAHMSTRNTVGCMIMGQGAGAAAALCAKNNFLTRTLPYPMLREELLRQHVILE